MNKNKCKNCNTEIDLYQSSISKKNGKKYFHYKKPFKKFCSEQCSGKYRLKNETRECQQCNKKFVCKPHQDHKFCSQSCSSSFNKNCLKRDLNKKPKIKIKHFRCNDCDTATNFKKYCDICIRIRKQIYQKKRNPIRRKKINEYTLSIKNMLIKQKGGCCQICGYNNSVSALTFHHRDPNDKKFTLDRAHLYNKHIDVIQEEIKKCDLLCFNCHMELHHG